MANRFKERPSIEELRALLQYDPSTGIVTWRSTRKGRGCQVGKRAGTLSGSGKYRCVTVCYVKMLEHVVVWALFHGEWPASIMDHVDGDGLNNRIDNLRLATSSQNVMNSRRRANNTSGFKGVHLNRAGGPRPWIAQIMVDGKRIYLGVYATAEEAWGVYSSAADRLFGEFARCA